jgi:hypothetical protein
VSPDASCAVTVTLKGSPAVVEDAALTAKWSTGMVARIM